jgi:hypothetical protein
MKDYIFGISVVIAGIFILSISCIYFTSGQSNGGLKSNPPPNPPGFLIGCDNGTGMFLVTSSEEAEIICQAYYKAQSDAQEEINNTHKSYCKYLVSIHAGMDEDTFYMCRFLGIIK